MDKKEGLVSREITAPENPWDSMPQFYDTWRKDIWYGAADNIMTAWPVMLNAIRERFPHPTKLRAMDFGCGAGMFCGELRGLGFDVTGVDLSPRLIDIARKHLDPQIQMVVGDTAAAQKLAQGKGKFDLVTSIMLPQFIKEAKLAELADTIKEGGMFLFANHNPERLKELGVGDTLSFADTEIRTPIYKRTIQDYNVLLIKCGFQKVFEKFVRQDKKFLKKYEIKRITQNPKYMILGYQKVERK